MTAFKTTSELLAAAEAARLVQREMVSWPRLARSDSAWGHLNRAILQILTEYFTDIAWSNPDKAAKLVLRESHVNNEDLAQQIRRISQRKITV